MQMFFFQFKVIFFFITQLFNKNQFVTSYINIKISLHILMLGLGDFPDFID